MKNAIIIHGSCDKEEYYSDRYPSLSNSHWLPWLQKKLLINDIPTATPEIPNAFRPDYDVWKKEFERFEVNPKTILIGHICGGGFLIRWLSENKDKKVGQVILVAPWLDPDRERTTNFFEFNLDSELASRTGGLTIFHSDDDMESVQKSVKTIRAEVSNIGYKEFHSYGHFTKSDMGTDEFPEILEAALS